MKSIDELKVIELENLILDLAKVVEENRRLRKKLEEAEKKKTEDIMKEKIDFLDISVRLYNSLYRAKIYTVEDLCNKTYLDIYKIRGIGDSTLKELIKMMEAYNLHFAD